MLSRLQLVEKLVSTLHLSVAERQLLEPSSLRVSEVRAVVERLLRDSGHFPPHAKTWRKGEVAFEGYFLQRVEDGSVKLWWQRSYPTVPTQMAEQQHEDFVDVGSAVSAFVEREWPRGIDGIRIIPD